jgi:hypothetical protein
MDAVHILRRRFPGAAAVAVLALGAGALAGAGPSRAQPRGHAASTPRTYSACPGGDRVELRSSAAGARARLVPLGVRRALMCRYRGLNPAGPSALRLIAHRLSTTAQARILASELDALKPVHGVQACPSDDDAAIIAIFRYGSARKADDPVTIHLDGCNLTTNGHVNREAGATIIRQIEAMTT